MHTPYSPPLPPSHTLTQDVWLTAADGTKLHAWLLTPRGWSKAQLKARPVLMFFQENAGNMSHRLPFLRGLARMLQVAIFAPRWVGRGGACFLGGRREEGDAGTPCIPNHLHLPASTHTNKKNLPPPSPPPSKKTPTTWGQSEGKPNHSLTPTLVDFPLS